MDRGKWVKSSRCDSATCVEVMVSENGNVYVRNSMFPDDTISMTKHEWGHLVEAVREFKEED